MIAESPKPEQVRALRRDNGLSSAQCGALVHTTGRVWLQWESGDRDMHATFYQLAQWKISRAREAYGPDWTKDRKEANAIIARYAATF